MVSARPSTKEKKKSNASNAAAEEEEEPEPRNTSHAADAPTATTYNVRDYQNPDAGSDQAHTHRMRF